MADGSTARQRALDFLAAARKSDGSWGYLANGPGAFEPTLLAAASGAGTPVEWLSRADLSWGELLLPAALSRVPEAAPLRRRCVERILSLEARKAPLDRAVVDQDPELTGWPWVDGTVAWVEPTAYAVISLKSVGRADAQRARDGETLLLDRQCADGGWNYGNPRVNGIALESDLPPTAWAVMAVAPGTAADRGLERLLDARRLASPMTLSLAILARIVHHADVEDLPDLLAQRQDPDGSFRGRSDWTALAACALGAVVEGSSAFSI